MIEHNKVHKMAVDLVTRSEESWNEIPKLDRYKNMNELKIENWERVVPNHVFVLTKFEFSGIYKSKKRVKKGTMEKINVAFAIYRHRCSQFTAISTPNYHAITNFKRDYNEKWSAGDMDPLKLPFEMWKMIFESTSFTPKDVASIVSSHPFFRKVVRQCRVTMALPCLFDYRGHTKEYLDFMVPRTTIINDGFMTGRLRSYTVPSWIRNYVPNARVEVRWNIKKAFDLVTRTEQHLFFPLPIDVIDDDITLKISILNNKFDHYISHWSYQTYGLGNPPFSEMGTTRSLGFNGGQVNLNKMKKRIQMHWNAWNAIAAPNDDTYEYFKALTMMDVNVMPTRAKFCHTLTCPPGITNWYDIVEKRCKRIVDLDFKFVKDIKIEIKMRQRLIIQAMLRGRENIFFAKVYH